MWETVCVTNHCNWSSKYRHLREAAIVLGKLHEEDCPGHKTVLKEKGWTSSRRDIAVEAQ